MNRLVWPYAGLLLALAWPVLGVDVPVGVDTLAHIARVFVRAHIGTDPDLQRLFVMQPTLVPYLGLDWLMSPLARVMDPLQLARAVTVALVWGTVLSVVVLQRVITGRLGLEPLAAGLVAYNAAVAWGFLSYVLGHILAVLGLAAWHAWRGWPAAWRLGMFSAVCVALYLTHLLALALYGGLVVLHALVEWRRGRAPGLVLVAQFVPAAALLVAAIPPVPQGALGILYNVPTSIIGAASPFIFRGGFGELESGHLVLVLALATAYLLTRAGLLTWDPTLAPMAAVVAVVGLAMPVAAAGISWVNLRLPLAAACLAIAAMRYRGPPVLSVWLAGLVLVRVAMLAPQCAAAPHTTLSCARPWPPCPAGSCWSLSLSATLPPEPAAHSPSISTSPTW